MGDKTKIEWTDSTWNPIRARNLKTGRVGHYCRKVSQGCANCYAERFNLKPRGNIGTGLPYTVAAGEDLELFLDEETLSQPLRWQRPRMIFVCSMTDLFGEFIPEPWIDRVFAVMLRARRHTFQVLTKRSKRMRDYSQASYVPGGILVADPSPLDDPEADPQRWPLPNVWLGGSVENQEALDARAVDILETKAAVRFLSAEPLLGPMDFRLGGMALPDYAPHRPLPKHDWVIVGGESGPGARPMDLSWARSIVTQCRLGGVACFVKQLGAWPIGKWGPASMADHPAIGRSYRPGRWKLADRKGGDPTEWPRDLRVREWPR